MENNTRASFYVTEELAEAINKLKQSKFYDTSYADLYRFIIEKGLEAIEKGN